MAADEGFPGGVDEPEPEILLERRLEVADPLELEVIEQAPGVDARVRGPPQPVLDAPGAHPSGGQLPELLDSERVGLRAVPAGELVARDELLRERAARALGEHRERGVDLDAGGEVGAGLALAGESHVADAHALDGAALIEEGRRGGEAREDLDAEPLGAGGEPGGELTERDDVVAAIVEGRRVDNRARQKPD